MNTATFYALIGTGLFSIALFGLFTLRDLLRKILSVNLLGSGVFLILVSLAGRATDAPPDAVSHAMVITGIVVAVSATALALNLMLKLSEATGSTDLPDDSEG